MKTRKVHNQLPNLYYRPEFEQCPNCGAPLTRSHTAWRKTITGMNGSARIYNQAYRCRDKEMCGDPTRVYRSIYADGLSLPYYTYGLDVIVYIGQARLRQHQTIPEIHKALNHVTPAIPISEREVEYLFDVYLLLLACSHGQRIEKYRTEMEAQGGVVLAIDGARPEKGQPGLYIFRDAVTGCRLHAAVLYSADTNSIVRELQVVAALGLPIQAIISDDEKATVAAVAQVWPHKPHGLCHIHFLKVVQKPIYEADRQLATALRKPLRALNKIERLLQHSPELIDLLSSDQKQALRRYLDALRAVLLTKGQSPFRLAGATIFQRLAQLTDSLARSHSQQAHSVLTQLQQLTQPHLAYQADYERIQRQQNWFLGLTDLLNVSTTQIHQWATKTGAEVAQEVDDYLQSLACLGDELTEDASFFDHMLRCTARWASGLYWTYEVSALPRTNNELEADIGDIKEQYRRITGRRTLKDYLMRYGPYLAFDDDQDDPEELRQWFAEIERQEFVNEKAKLEAMREKLRNMQRFRQDPLDFLAETERLWAESD